MPIDVRQSALRALEIAKQNLLGDGCLHPVALVITEDEELVFDAAFQGQEEKVAVYQRLVRFAKENNALAVVTLNDAYYGTKEDAENYYPGKLKAEHRPECIYLTVSGPEIPLWSITVPYTRVSGEIVFGEAEEEGGGTFNLLQGWPD
jgi:hypothetical protein